MHATHTQAMQEAYIALIHAYNYSMHISYILVKDVKAKPLQLETVET